MGGTLTLSGASGAIASSSGITIGGGATLQLDNTTINLNRIGNVTVTMNGGTFDFSHPTTSGADYTESVGQLSLSSGASTVSTDVSNTAASSSSVLTFASLARTAGATVNFGGGTSNPINDGTDNNNVRFGTGPTLVNGIIGPWATVGGTSFATYDTGGSTDSVEALATYGQAVTRLASGTKIIANTSTNNVQIIDGTGGAANITLAAATTTINTLTNSATGGTSTINPNNQTLQVGGILNASGSGALTIGNGTNNGTLSTNDSTAGELVLQNFSSNSLTINSVIANNTTASSLTTAGTGTTVLTGVNTFSGATTINAGTLQVAGTGSLSGTTSVAVNGGTRLLSGSASDRINNAATVALANASKLSVSGAVTETFGAMTLSGNNGGTASVIDFGAGGSSLTFASIASSVAVVALQIWNWTDNGGPADHLIATSGFSGGNTSLTDIAFYSDSGTTSLGTAKWLSGGTTGELVPVPEPGALFAGLALMAPLAWRERRHWMRCRDARVA